MADHSGIEWTEATWNPTTGCDRVSPGCDNSAYCSAVHSPTRVLPVPQAITAWDEGYVHVQEFVEREAHANVPARFATDDGFKLGT